MNCCSVNSPRGLGLISEWALLQDPDGLVLNYYGPGSIRTSLSNDIPVELRQETVYPVSGRILLHVTPSTPAVFTLKLRIPYWSRSTHLSLNHQVLDGAQPGRYYEIKREWKAGDVVEVELDMSLHFWRGEKQCQGLASVYRGPLLLAFDQRYNRQLAGQQKPKTIPDDPFKVSREYLSVPLLDANQMYPLYPAASSAMSNQIMEWDGWLSPILLVETRTAKGELVRLCDFASAGATGSLYRSWLPIVHAPRRPRFSRANPLRSAH